MRMNVDDLNLVLLNELYIFYYYIKLSQTKNNKLNLISLKIFLYYTTKLNVIEILNQSDTIANCQVKIFSKGIVKSSIIWETKKTVSCQSIMSKEDKNQ